MKNPDVVKFLDLKKINDRFDGQFQTALKVVMDSAWYIRGKQLELFESEFATYCGTTHCIGVGNGYDALYLILKAYKIMGKLKDGDELIVPANTFIATILAITHNNLIPVLTEPEIDNFNLSVSEVRQKLSSKTKAILGVHLYGQLCNMKDLKEICGQNNLLLIEDAAQSHGAKSDSGKRAGNLGDAAAFSFYPAKNLGALGDGGAITTNDEEMANVIRKISNYGSDVKDSFEYRGVNSRLDEIQAAFLRIKLPDLDADNDRRRQIANQYQSKISNPKINKPSWNGVENHVFHLYVIQTDNRDELLKYMDENDVECLVHYAIAPHKQNALPDYNNLSLPITEEIHRRVLSIPISPVMTDVEVEYVIDTLNSY